MSDVELQNDAFSRASVQDHGIALHVTRRIEQYGLGGDMVGALGDDFYPSEVKSSIERPAILAFNVYHEAASEDPSYERFEGTRRFMPAVLMSLTNERDEGLEGRSDIDRAHAILKAVSIVEAAEFPSHFEPSSQMIGTIFGSTGVEASSLEKESTRVMVGMADLIEDPELAKSIKLGIQPVSADQSDSFLQSAIGRHLAKNEAELLPIGKPVSQEAEANINISNAAAERAYRNGYGIS